MPRPARPMMVAAPAALVKRILSNVLDAALAATPAGGQVCISARKEGSGVQLVVLHTGRSIGDAALLQQQQQQANVAASAGGGPQAVTFSSAAAGSGATSLAVAEQAVHSVRGRLRLFYPANMVNGFTGRLDVGTCIEIYLPVPAAAGQQAATGGASAAAVEVLVRSDW